MFSKAINKVAMFTGLFNKMLALSLTSCLLVACPRSFGENRSTKTLPSVEKYKGQLYYRPSYFRQMVEIDWQTGFREGLGQVEVDGKWGFINSTGKLAIEPKFDQVIEFDEGLAPVRIGAMINKPKAALFGLIGRWAYIDQAGRTVIEREGNSFSEGLATVLVRGKWKTESGLEGTLTKERGRYGVIDKDERMIVPPKYSLINPFSEGLAVFCEQDLTASNAKYGYLNTTGEVAIEPRYDAAFDFSEGLALVVDSGKGAFINRAGEVVLHVPYAVAPSFGEGIVPAKVKEEQKWGYIDKTGRLVIPFKFDRAMTFSEGYAGVVEDGKIGYINRKGEYVIKPRFPYYSTWKTPFGRRYNPFFSSFSEGVAPVMTEKLKWGYIDKKGEFVIKPKFDLAGQFTEGFAKVAVGDKLGYINKQGDYIWEPTR